jgi:hypothetical protein
MPLLDTLGKRCTVGLNSGACDDTRVLNLRFWLKRADAIKLLLGRGGTRSDTRMHPAFHLLRKGGTHQAFWHGAHVASVQSCLNLKNAFSGPCFILGAGPSLGQVDVDRLGPYATMTLNGAIQRYADGRRPTHHVMVDTNVITRHPEFAIKGINGGAHCFFAYKCLSRICEHDPALLGAPNVRLIEAIDKKYDQPPSPRRAFFERYRAAAGIYLPEPDTGGSPRIGFSAVPELGFFGSRTVAIWAIQLAYMLGYRALFLLGMELGATGSHHFYDVGHASGIGRGRDHYETDIKRCFMLARQASIELGFTIHNLTPVSRLSGEIVPRMTFEEALAMAESHRREKCGRLSSATSN